MNIGTSTSTTITNYCKYHLPCGYCELKKEQCTYFIPITATPFKPFDPRKNDVISVYGCPSWDVTCTAGRSEE